MLAEQYLAACHGHSGQGDPAKENKCPACSLTAHDTNHLFSCPSNPTVLTSEKLRTNPVLAAHILKLGTEPHLPHYIEAPDKIFCRSKPILDGRNLYL